MLAADVVEMITTDPPGEQAVRVLAVTLAEAVMLVSPTTYLVNLDKVVAAVLVLVVTITTWVAVAALASMVRVQTVLAVLSVLALLPQDKVDLVDNLEITNLPLEAAHAVTAASMVVAAVEPSQATTKAVEVLRVLLGLSGVIPT